MYLNDDELSLLRQWFNALEDVSPAYLEDDDKILAKRIYDEIAKRRKGPPRPSSPPDHTPIA